MDGLRTSSYTIYVELPDNAAEVLLVHGFTGAYDRVARPVASFLRAREAGRPPKPLYGEWTTDLELAAAPAAPEPATLAALERRGHLTHLTPEEETAAFSGLVAKLHHRSLMARPSYILMPTYNCNLRCSYCFQDSLRTDPARRALLRVMAPAMVDRIFAAMLHIESARQDVGAPGDARRIGFFGGEPLMAETRPIVQYIMKRAREHGNPSFWAVTNATGLEHFHDLLGPDGIADLQITLDGPPAEHDQRRVHADGSGSFELIARNLDLALARGVIVSVRINVDRNNCAMLPALAAEIVARGWPGSPNFSVYTAPIWAGNGQTDPATTFGSWELDREIERLRLEHDSMRIVGTPDDRLKAQVRRIFDERYDPLPSFRTAYCGAHTNMYIFDAFGDIYACWERTGDARIRIGSIDAAGAPSLRAELNDEWRSRTVTSNPVCNRCRYALYCGGGCAIRAVQTSGQFFKNYCDSFQQRFRVTVQEAHSDHLHGRAGLNQSRVCDL